MASDPRFGARRYLSGANTAIGQIMQAGNNITNRLAGLGDRQADARSAKANDFIDGLRTEEQYQAALDSGQLTSEGLTGAFGGRLNKDVFSNAKGQQKENRDNFLSTTAFIDKKAEIAERPDIAIANKFKVKGDMQGLAEFLPNSNIRDPSQLIADTEKQFKLNRDSNRTEDAYQDELKITQFVRDQGIQNQSAISDIRNKQATFAKENPNVSFNADGSIEFDPTLTPEQKSFIQNKYANYAENFPKILSENDLVKGVQNFANQLKASAGLEANAVRSSRENEQIRTQLSKNDAELLQSADATTMQNYNVNKTKLDNNLQYIIDTTPVDNVVTAEQQKIGPDAAFVSLRKQIADYKKEGNDLGDNFDDDGSDLIAVTNAMTAANNVGFPNPDGGKNLPYPNWVKLRAFEQVGVSGVFQPGFMGDTTDAAAYKKALDSIMAEHVASSKNRKIIADAKARHLKESAKLEAQRKSDLGNHLKQAKSKSGIFNTDNADPAKIISRLNKLTINR